jgi:hypothetical protein
MLLPTHRSGRFFQVSIVTIIGLPGILIATLPLSPTWATEPNPDFYVSPQGNDAWSGRLAEPNAAKSDGPLATVACAQQQVRELKQKQPGRDQPIVVAIRGGMYFLAKPLEFLPEDSGTEKAPVIYQAHGQERPILSGGVKIEGWQVAADGRWQVELEGVKNGKWSFAQLFVNDQRRFRPRLPKQGYYRIARQLPPSDAAAGKGHDRFGYSGNELRPDWANLSDVEVLAFHQWTASRMRIGSLAPQQHVVTFTGTTRGTSSWATFPKGHRFLVENVREALSEPGQWYLDRPSGKLTYIPLPGEQPDKAVVIAPRLERLVTFAGDVKGHRWVRHIQLRGLTFAHSNWTLPPEGQSFPQAEVNLDAAIAALGARNVVIDGCAVRHAGQYAFAFGAGCRENRVENCEMVDLGGGGVMIGRIGGAGGHSWDRAPADDEELVSRHTVRNCTIAHGGRLHSAAVGVWIGHSPYNVIQHNDIFDLYYTGISVGWVWGYAHSHAHHNDIGFNRVRTIGQRVLSDMGGIYSLGVSPGTRIHDNVFHDIQSFDYGGWGLYTDEGSSGIVLENNLVYRTKTGGFHQHYGKENRVQNNIFVDAARQQVQRTRTEPHISFWFERNIVAWTNPSPLLGSNWNDDNFKLDYNLYWHGGKEVEFPGGLTLDEWRSKRKQDEHSLIADPRLVAAEKDDYRLKPDSPALQLGFTPFDPSKAGRTSPPVLTKDLPPVPKGFE